MHYGHSNSARTEPLYAALRYGMLLLLLAPSAVSLPASAAQTDGAQIVCPALLLDHECRAYKADMSSATTADTRDTIKARYADLLSARKRACFCNPDRSWIQLTSTALVPREASQDKTRIRL